MKFNKMNNRNNLGIAMLIFIAAMFVSSCGKNADAGENNTATVSSERIFPVEVQKIHKQAISRTLDYTADLIPFEEVHYAPASPGRIDQINVEIGSRVSIGQVLVEMDKNQLTQAKTQLANARYNFQRIDTLFQLGSISEQQYEQAKTQYDLAKSSVEYLSENTTLVSPINGIVTGKYFENGELYSAAPNTAAGKAAIVSLMQINPLKAMVSVSQSYFPKIKKGMTARVSSDIYPDKVFDASVYKVHPTINPDTRTFQLEMLVANDNEILRPGMFATISLALYEAEALVVPAIAILKQQGTNNRYIFVNDQGIARQVDVQIGKRVDDKIELKANGISEGTELIVAGQANLLNGSKINVTNK